MPENLRDADLTGVNLRGVNAILKECSDVEVVRARIAY